MTNFEKLKSLSEDGIAKSLAEIIYNNAVYVANNCTDENSYVKYLDVIKKWLHEECTPIISLPIFRTQNMHLANGVY